MKAFKIEKSVSTAVLYTSDFLDVLNEVESTPDREQVMITPMEMTVNEFNDILRENARVEIESRD